MVENFEFLKDSPILVPQILSNFIFLSYLLAYPEMLMYLAKQIKSLNFGVLAREGHLKLFESTPNFLKFYLFFIFTYSKSFFSLE